MRTSLRVAGAVAAAWLLLLSPGALAADTVQRIYTTPNPQDTGGIKGSCEANITHALAVNHDHLRVYRGAVSADGRAFDFEHLPLGKFDLVMVTRDKLVYEGITLGAPSRSDLPSASMANLNIRIDKQDAFFNHTKIHRLGFDGANCYAFVERTSDRKILRQDGTALGADLRRLEIIELAQADDTWQVTTTRHLYREEQPVEGIDFLTDKFVPEFSNLRVIDSVKDIGKVLLPNL
jgi:hypothetical protein